MSLHLRRAAVAAFLALAVFVAPAAPQTPLATYGKSALTIETTGGKQHFAVEEAKTPQQMAQGLMFRRVMAADAGMLFEYDRVQPVQFWMKNTLIPLDMIFIGGDGTIVGMKTNTTPLSLAPQSVGRPSRWVIEVAGGYAARAGIAAGDKVELPAA